MSPARVANCRSVTVWLKARVARLAGTLDGDVPTGLGAAMPRRNIFHHKTTKS